MANSPDYEADRLRRIAATLEQVKRDAVQASGNAPLQRDLTRTLDALLEELTRAARAPRGDER